jgi:hypothetical protein
MVGVVKTLTALIAEVDAVLADSQGAATITPARVRQLEEDFGVSVAAWAGASGRTIVALDISTVTTGGTAVTALSAGHATAGGFIKNPENATQNLGINQNGTASGTTSNGSTFFIVPGETFQLTASGNAVSVISADSAHPFAGEGWQ